MTNLRSARSKRRDCKGKLRTSRARPSMSIEAPVRLWHWVNAAGIAVLDRDRLSHRLAAAVDRRRGERPFRDGLYPLRAFRCGPDAGGAFLARILWAFVGNEHSRQLFYVPFWRRRYWFEAAAMSLRWYLFLVKNPKKYVGHNPLANLAC